MGDPSLFREMSQPFDGPKAAEEALDKFFEMVGEARKQCHVPEVMCVVSVNIKYPPIGDEAADEGQVITMFHYGSSLMQESLAAWALGFTAAERQENIAKMIGRAEKVSKKRQKDK